MKLINRSQAYELDKTAILSMNLTMDKLVEMAGEALFKKIISLFSINQNLVNNSGKNTVNLEFIFLIGPGNNGRDGIEIQKRMKSFFPHIKTRSLGLSELCEKNQLDLNSIEGTEIIIVDALFGIGFNKEFQGVLKNQINRINDFVLKNKKRVRVVSLDIPSGLDCDTGTICSVAIKADFTLTCELPKVGLFLNLGPLYSGKIINVPIGIEKQIDQKIAKTIRLIQRKNLISIMPKRSVLGNKTHQGKLLIVAGSVNMFGALRLCAEAAARMGVGYVTIAMEEEWIQNINFYQKLFPDFLLIKKMDLLKLSSTELSLKYNAILIGPGLIDSSLNQQLFANLFLSRIKILVDAEGINLMKKLKLKPHASVLLTPHAGELSRIIKMNADEIEHFRLKSCDLFLEIYPEAKLLLKGHKTIVASSDKRYVIISGNKSLSKAGTGDVLAGIIGSLLAQGLDITKASALAAFIHGDIADRWVRSGNSFRSLMASDLITSLKNYNL